MEVIKNDAETRQQIEDIGTIELAILNNKAYVFKKLVQKNLNDLEFLIRAFTSAVYQLTAASIDKNEDAIRISQDGLQQVIAQANQLLDQCGNLAHRKDTGNGTK